MSHFTTILKELLISSRSHPYCPHSPVFLPQIRCILGVFLAVLTLCEHIHCTNILISNVFRLIVKTQHLTIFSMKLLLPCGHIVLPQVVHLNSLMPMVMVIYPRRSLEMLSQPSIPHCLNQKLHYPKIKQTLSYYHNAIRCCENTFGSTKILIIRR